MKFHDYADTWTAITKSDLNKILKFRNREDMHMWLMQCQPHNQLGYHHLIFDMMWHREGKPYYDVYPSIIPMLTRLSLDFPGSAITGINDALFTVDEKATKFGPFRVMNLDQARITMDKLATMTRRFTNLLIRLPEINHELYFEDRIHGRIQVRSIYVSFQPISKANKVTLGLVIGIDVGERDENGIIPMHTMRVFPLDNRSVEENIYDLPRHHTADEGLQIPEKLMISCIRLAITLCLLDDNPELIEPDILNCDKHRIVGADNELLQKLIDRAKRRGKYGFLIGKKYEDQYEVSPHIRMPHPCLVWTGKGRSQPKIVLRKGSLIHRKKVGDVPTGYQDDNYED